MPAVISITSTTPGAASTSVVYTVQFDSLMSGVDISDFSLSQVSSAAGSITGFSQGIDTSIYTVTVSGISGQGSLRLDLNSTGTGITDSSNVPIAGGFTSGALHTVDRIAPTVSSIDPVGSAPTSANSVNYTVTFAEAITGIDANDFTLTKTGSADANISGVFGSGNVYTVTVNGVIGDGALRLDLNNAGTGIADLAGNAIANVAFTSGQSYTLDHTAPTVASVSVPGNSTYGEGSSLDFAVNFNEAVTVSGTPRIALTLDVGGTVYANYVSGGGSSSLVFRHTVQAGEADNNGVSLHGAIDLNGGSLNDAAGNNATLALNSVGALGGVLVDGIVPVITSVTVPSNGTFGAGQQLSFTVNFSESVTVVGSPYLDLTIGSNAVRAQYATGSGTSSLQFTYVIASGSLDANGIALGAALTLNGGSLKNGLGANAALTLNSVGTTTGVLVDAVVPEMSSISLVNAAITNASSVNFTVVFSKAVTGVDTNDFALNKTSSANGVITGVSGSGTTYTVSVTSATGDGNLRLDLNATGTNIIDGSGNAILGGYTSGASYTLDHTAPAVGSVGVPADARYAVGTQLDFTVNFNEAVTVNTLGGTPRLAVTIDGPTTVYANYVSGSGTTAVVFRYTVGNGNSDQDGVALVGLIDLQGGTLKDAVGNNAVLALNSVGALSGVLVGAPVVVTPVEPSTPAAPGTPGTADGVAIFTSTVVDPATGLRNTTVTLPVVGGPRIDDPSTPNAALADIPLGILASGGTPAVNLLLSLPVGTGMVATGPDVLLNPAQSLADLISRITQKTGAGSSAQTEMTGQVREFLAQLPGDTSLATRSIALTSTGSAPQTFLISGDSTASAKHAAIGLVIDATALPAGSIVQLDNVDFAAVIGNVTIRGGAGKNVVIGDGAAQRILLGADDDLAYGGAGNDVLVGGVGSDRLVGGTGDDVLQGGRSDVGQWDFFLGSDGRITARHQTAASDAIATEKIATTELNQAAPELNFLGANTTNLANVALLYEAAFGRKADLTGLSFWAASGLSPQVLAQAFIGSSEWRAAGGDTLGDAALVQALYRQTLGREADEAGLKYWVGKLAGSVNEAPISRATLLSSIALSDEHRSISNSTDGLAIGTANVKTEGSWLLGSGNDTLEGGAGNDILIGGDGTDTIVYGKSLDAYRIALSRDGKVLVVDKANGDVDTVSGIELGSFNGVMVDLAFTQVSQATLQRVGLLYQTVFDRAADVNGLAFWANPALSSAQVAAGFTGSSEYQARFGATNDKQFVQALYANVGLSDTAAGGVGQWESFLSTHSRDQLLLAWIGDEAVVASQFANGGLWLA